MEMHQSKVIIRICAKPQNKSQLEVFYMLCKITTSLLCDNPQSSYAANLISNQYKSIQQPVTAQLLLNTYKITPSYLSRAQLECLCDLDIPLLLCSFACRQCWIQHFSIQSNELLQILSRGFWEISHGFLRWLRWSPSLRRSPRWRKREHCCHWDSRSLLWSSSPFLAPWWKEIGYLKIKKVYEKIISYEKEMQCLYTDLYLCPAKSRRHDQWFLCRQFIEMCDGWITARDAVIIRLSASWSPVKDKETPVARLTLSDGLCEKQPWAHAQAFTAPSFRLLEQGREVWHWARWQVWSNSWKTAQRKIHLTR